MSLISVNWNPPPRQLRGFGWIALIAFGLIGAWIYWRHSIFGAAMQPATAGNTALVLWTLAGCCGLLALAAPAALKPLYVVLTAVSLPIGFVLSHVIMAIVFYVVLTPVGLIFRAIGRDPLHRRFEPTASTYWVPREPARDAQRYYRQF